MSISAIRFQIIDSEPEKTRADCIVVGINTAGKLTGSTKQLDRACNGIIQRAVKQGDLH